ncbi:G kinase-anchoring protein 1-A-like [Toxorhynchites rutilus septentrionalis]|uniref:G kinase-anchoring protein 1-A-like n=1 Tax=Toxorhynchites rutilus septentrionalis TaxID=329112 RepID=UPI00247A2091|nr:G kinase-anchoring protein 1-A-like [Toxorhynchites rutilus septentrionalis]
MVTIVPSRFAGLRIEDDDDDCAKPSRNQKNTSSQKHSQSTSTGKHIQAGNQQNRKALKPKKPRKPVNEEAQNKQWSQWQEKDTEIVDTHYEKDLEQAVLLSKLDFEANKTKYLKAEQEVKQNSKSKKSRPLSLQQFQTKIDKDISEKEVQKQRKEEEVEYNKKFSFFEQINRETKQIIQKEQIKSLVANREYCPESSSPTENGNSENASPEACELDQLRAENAALRAELEALRVRHKKICSVLKTGEMKDKTELLLEIEKLKKAREDTAAEMTALYEQLEQEKSKIGGSGQEKGKEKPGGRKSVRFDASSEAHNGRAE